MRRAVILIATVLSIGALTSTYAVARGLSPSAPAYHPPTASRETLATVADARVLFAHHSVGGNVLSGLPAVYQAHDLTAPKFVDLSDAEPGDNLIHLRIGQNGDPLGKITEFDSLIRSGLGDELDVAVLKLCYVDIRRDADINGVFTAYRDTYARLQQDYPSVRFVAATVPLQVKRGPLGTLKSWVGRGDTLGSEHNAAREELNALLRAEYADTNLLFDIASIESTTQGGDRVTGRHDGATYFALNKAYAADAGHLNDIGSAVVAESLLAVIVAALKD